MTDWKRGDVFVRQGWEYAVLERTPNGRIRAIDGSGDCSEFDPIDMGTLCKRPELSVGMRVRFVDHWDGHAERTAVVLSRPGRNSVNVTMPDGRVIGTVDNAIPIWDEKTEAKFGGARKAGKSSLVREEGRRMTDEEAGKVFKRGDVVEWKGDIYVIWDNDHNCMRYDAVPLTSWAKCVAAGGLLSGSYHFVLTWEAVANGDVKPVRPTEVGHWCRFRGEGPFAVSRVLDSDDVHLDGVEYAVDMTTLQRVMPPDDVSSVVSVDGPTTVTTPNDGRTYHVTDNSTKPVTEAECIDNRRLRDQVWVLESDVKWLRSELDKEIAARDRRSQVAWKMESKIGEMRKMLATCREEIGMKRWRDMFGEGELP